jgi:Ran GTPase-activating protein (RanGAP) involved in mRNA processing and transport
LSNTNLQREDATVIASIIASNSNVLKLDVSCNNFLSSGIAAIARALSKSNSVTDFDVSRSDVVSRETDSSKSETLANALCAMIKLNLSIKRLNISAMFLSEDCIKLVMSALQTNQTITELDISGNILTESGIAALSNMLSSNSSISKLRMCEITDSVFKLAVSNNLNVLFDAFNFNSSITDLEIDCTGVSIAGARAFASMIASNSKILKLAISEMFVSEFHLIFDALAQNRSLVELSTCIPSLDDPASELELSRALSNMIRCNSAIARLDLSRSDFSRESIVISIVRALSQNVCIQELILNDCRINSDGGIALANMLSSNTTLTKLNLNSNDFAREGLLMIIMALRHNSSIQDIGLELRLGSQIEDRGSFLSHAIAETVRCNTSITRLNIAKFGKGFGKDSALEIVSALKNNQSITDINLQSCFYFLESKDNFNAAVAIADLIASPDCRIQTLNLSFNSFSSVEMVLLADALSSSQSITSLCVTGNCLQICDKAINRFVNSIKKNRNINSIKLVDASEFDRCRKTFDEKTKRLADKSLMQYPQLECPGVPYVYNYLDQ